MTTVLGGASAPVAVSGTRKWWALGALGLAKTPGRRFKAFAAGVG